MRQRPSKFHLGFVVILSAALAKGCTQSQNPTDSSKPSRYKVGVFLAADHPVIDQFHKGFVDGLEAKSWIKSNGVDYTLRNAGGDATAINTIAGEMAEGDFAAIYVVGVPATQALLRRQPKSPVVCGGSFDPLDVGIAESWNHPGKGATGATALAPIKEQLDLLKELSPSTKSLAVLYSPGEAQASAVAKTVEKVGPAQGIKVQLVPVSTSSEIKAALAKAEASDAYYVGTDNSLHSVIKTVADAALEAKKPLVNCSEASVQKGALFSLAVDYYQVGKSAADLMDAVVIEKKSASDVPFRRIDDPDLYLNIQTARSLNVTIPKDLLGSAIVYPKQ